MAFILAEHRASGVEVVANFQRYREYLNANQSRFPPRAFELASAEWYFDATDHRCPHDAWLEAVTIEEPAAGKRREERTVAIRTRLFGAYHDGYLEFYYPRVFEYSLNLKDGERGHRDWLYDEFRLSPEGHVVHEIQWSGPRETGRWMIKASDVEFVWRPSSSDSRLTSA